ncbi:unnamed protein product [Orchesella dallaii]|uniref:G-protein coupled receptors family 1 profile domain-containing protein n=1 Tax=Orchesella dallaii TaxID=48710 RepID=A0ABP1PQD8_9HEXA
MFITGDSLHDHESAAHYIRMRQEEKRAFDFLLIVLSAFDLFSSLMAVIWVTGMIAFYEVWDKGPITVFMIYVPFLLCLLGRSGSIYMTVLITIERYLVIAFPMELGTWFTAIKTKALTAAVTLLAILVNIPRLSGIIITKNDEGGKNLASLHDLDCIIVETKLNNFWYETCFAIHHKIDVYLPFPLLIVYNFLLFMEIRKFSKKRLALQMNKSRMREIRAAKMFLPVAVVLVISLLYVFVILTDISYREFAMLLGLTVVVNAAANLPIYYAMSPGSSFRKTLWEVLPCGWKEKNKSCNRGIRNPATLNNNQF